MRNSPILIVAPLLALADQSVAYALVEWGCRVGHRGVPVAVQGVFLLAAVVLTIIGWRQCGATKAGTRSDAAAATQNLIAWVGMAAAGLSTLVIAMMMVAAIVVSPCIG
jgi:hypothetical protein